VPARNRRVSTDPQGAAMTLDDDDIRSTGPAAGHGPADGGANPAGRDGGADGGAGPKAQEGPADGGANPAGRDGGADGAANRR